MKIVSPREFRNAFVEVLQAENAAFRTAVGFEPKSYSYFMRTNMFPKMAKSLGLLAWNKEYQTLDGMFYEERGTDHFDRYTNYPKWMSVAVEHCARPSKNYDEMNKLQMFNVPLKVLITYASEGADSDAMLRGYESIMSNADIFADFASLRRQLVIVGTPKTVRNWRFYAYESDGFVLMLPN